MEGDKDTRRSKRKPRQIEKALRIQGQGEHVSRPSRSKNPHIESTKRHGKGIAQDDEETVGYR